jgi:SpoVK/Ycf46/Vps4 family AAA+-type ATPase
VIDPAVVRSGRLDQHLFVGGITTSEGLALMGHALREKGWDIVEDAGDTAFHQLLQKYPHSQRYSVADWLAVTATAQQHALQIDRTSRTITSMGLQCALESTQPSISDAEWLRWDRLQAESAHRRNNNNSTTAAGSKSSHRPQKVTLA